MTRRLTLLAALLVLVLAACGGGVDENGGGDTTQATTVGTKPDNGTQGTTADTVDNGGNNGTNGDLPAGLDPRNILGDDQALNDLANQCFDGDMGACDQLFLDTPVDSDLEAYSQTCGGRIDEVDGNPHCAARFSAGEPERPASFGDAEFDSLASDCFDGDLGACDELFRVTPVDSEAEAYGNSCGGRVDDELRGSCEEFLGGSSSGSGGATATTAGT